MGLAFIKMHGLGNDYVYVDGFQHAVEDPEALARGVSNRHFGVGSDGLILVLPSDRADARMRMWNADGSEAEMCGNGVRCVAKLICDAGYAKGDDVRIEVGRGAATRVLAIRVERTDGRVGRARVAMGAPSFVRQVIPMVGPRDVEVVDEPLVLPESGETVQVTCVQVGNPHCVVFVDRPPGDAMVLGQGPILETLRVFPARINVEFVHVRPDGELEMRVWERGSGETLACGTGACASVAAAIRSGRIPGPSARIHLLGGPLEIRWDRPAAGDSAGTDQICMTGPAVEVFRGVLDDAWSPRPTAPHGPGSAGVLLHCP